MGEQEEILEENVEEYLRTGEEAFQRAHYNAAVTLFFKAICAAADLYICRKEGQAAEVLRDDAQELAKTATKREKT
jgi:hypothetical protein